jgi:hypothetical protein
LFILLKHTNRKKDAGLWCDIGEAELTPITKYSYCHLTNNLVLAWVKGSRLVLSTILNSISHIYTCYPVILVLVIL